MVQLTTDQVEALVAQAQRAINEYDARLREQAKSDKPNPERLQFLKGRTRFYGEIKKRLLEA